MNKIFQKLSQFFGAWEIGVLADGKEELWQVDPDPKNLGYLKAKNAEGLHIFVRPQEQEKFLLVDDLTWPRIQRDHQTGSGQWRPGRMCIETSPGNYQIWIRGDRSLSNEEKRFWLHRMGSDPGASPRGRWGRCPGFRNKKEKHAMGIETLSDGGRPLARLIWVDMTGLAHVPQIETPEENRTKPQNVPSTPRAAERGVVSSGRSLPSLPHEISRSNYDVGDESRTDFRFALALLRRGVSEAVVRARIEMERQDWTHHKGMRQKKYLDRTIKRARAALNGSRLGPGL